MRRRSVRPGPVSPSCNPRKVISVILAAGRGTRMGRGSTQKVCLPIQGKPAISLAIETYRRCGIDHHLIVVGDTAEQVSKAVPEEGGGSVLFCRQQEPRGTGNAARVAAQRLSETGYEGDVLVVAGDKVVAMKALLRLMNHFYDSGSDLAFGVGRLDDFPGAGRVVLDEQSRVIGIVEAPDIAKVQLLQALRARCERRPVTAGETRALVAEHFKSEGKAVVALGPLWEAVRLGRAIDRQTLQRHFTERDYSLQVQARAIPLDNLARAEYGNLSLYLFRAQAFYSATGQITSNNAQGEEYLTDAVGILAANGHTVSAVPVDDPHEVMAFNTPEELEAIEKYFEELDATP